MGVTRVHPYWWRGTRILGVTSLSLQTPTGLWLLLRPGHPGLVPLARHDGGGGGGAAGQVCARGPAAVHDQPGQLQLLRHLRGGVFRAQVHQRRRELHCSPSTASRRGGCHGHLIGHLSHPHLHQVLTVCAHHIMTMCAHHAFSHRR